MRRWFYWHVRLPLSFTFASAKPCGVCGAPMVKPRWRPWRRIATCKCTFNDAMAKFLVDTVRDQREHSSVLHAWLNDQPRAKVSGRHVEFPIKHGRSG